MLGLFLSRNPVNLTHLVHLGTVREDKPVSRLGGSVLRRGGPLSDARPSGYNPPRRLVSVSSVVLSRESHLLIRTNPSITAVVRLKSERTGSAATRGGHAIVGDSCSEGVDQNADCH